MTEAGSKLFPARAILNKKIHDKGEPGLFKEEIGCTEPLPEVTLFLGLFEQQVQIQQHRIKQANNRKSGD